MPSVSHPFCLISSHASASSDCGPNRPCAVLDEAGGSFAHETEGNRTTAWARSGI